MTEGEEAEPVIRSERCSASLVRRVAAMLDLAAVGLADGASLPKGWHFILLGADTRRSELRGDGFPGLGVSMPDLGLPRLMLGGRTVDYHRDVPIGSKIERSSAVRNVTRKEGTEGPLAIVTISHELRVDGDASPAISEMQTYVLLASQDRFREGSRHPQAVEGPLGTKTFTPDPTLLFQYSALGFNSHKIHIDRSYARDVEGYPDLVVNGGLTTLLLTEYARVELGLQPSRIKMKFLAPLFCGRPITIAADRDGQVWRLTAHDDIGSPAATMELETR